MDKIKEIIGRAFKSEQEKRLMGAAVLVPAWQGLLPFEDPWHRQSLNTP